MNMNKSTSMILQTFFSLFLLLSSERLSNYKRFTWCCNIFTLFLILLNSHHKLWKPFLFFITHFEIRQNCLDQFTIFKKTQKEKFNNTLRFYKKAYSWFRKKNTQNHTLTRSFFHTLLEWTRLGSELCNNAYKCLIYEVFATSSYTERLTSYIYCSYGRISFSHKIYTNSTHHHLRFNSIDSGYFRLIGRPTWFVVIMKLKHTNQSSKAKPIYQTP